MIFKSRVLAFRSLATRVFLLIAALAATAFGCGWMFQTSDSVRFSYETTREMARMPPLPTWLNKTNEIEVDDFETESNYELGQRHGGEADATWDRAEAAEEEEKLDLVAELLREYLERTRIERDFWFAPTDRRHRRNSAIDRLDALDALSHGSTKSRVLAYLNARRLHDEEKPADEVERALSQLELDLNLKDNIAYLKAAQLYRQDKLEAAAQAFSAIGRQYPRSEKREASLFMASVASMKASKSFTPTSGDESHLHEDEPEKIHPVVIDKPWHDALAGFKRLIAEYPRGRYVNAARGWVAYLMLRKNDRASALVEYYELLANKDDENARLEAAFSLTKVRHHATDADMSRVEKDLARKPEIALTYAYHNIFNYAVDPGPAYPPYREIKDHNGNYDYEASRLRYEGLEKDWEKSRSLTERRELERTLAFSRRLMESYPRLSIGGNFALRAAQASLELDHNETAVQFARRALQSRINDDARAQALLTSGLAEHRLHHFTAARQSLNTLLRDYPNSPLSVIARRTLAMIAEDEGDLDSALQQYIALEYHVDVAYFIDILMTVEQLENFLLQHPDSPKKNEFTYALGIRYLRANRWNDARSTFFRVQTIASENSSVYSSDDCLGVPAINCFDPKEPDRHAWGKHMIITPQMIMRDVQTANVLEAMERAVTQAQGDEASAEAMYQLASYQFEASSLLFYNPVAWRGGRYFNLSEFASAGNYRTTNEPHILFAYMQEHDTLARALKIYLEVVKTFPRTRAARDALYTAAVCHERLANYNGYWRGVYVAGLHAGSRMVTYADVKAAYPTYQLPRGTYGWQPSTRTVNGGPGWAAPPKYIPPPTRMARLKIKLENFIDAIQLFWVEKGRRGLSLIVILFGVWFTERIARQNRKLLRPKLARLRLDMLGPIVDHPRTTMFWTETMEEGRRERLKQFLIDRMAEFFELARDARSRPILLRSIFSHSFLAGLIVSLLWTLHFG
jgi:TolA-binding protein